MATPPLLPGGLPPPPPPPLAAPKAKAKAKAKPKAKKTKTKTKTKAKTDDFAPGKTASGVPLVSVVAWIVWFLILLAKIFMLLVWRLIVGFVVFFLDAGTSILNNRRTAGFLAILFVLGIGLQFFPQEIYTVSDEVYECGILPVAEGTASVLHTFFAIPYEWFAPLWNEPILFVFDGIGSIFGQLKTLERTGKVVSVARGATAITEALFGGTFDGLFSILQDIFEVLGDYFVGYATWFTSGIDYFARLIDTWFFTVSMFSNSCSLCSADPPPRECPLRTPFLPGQAEFDCNDCHEITIGLGRFIGRLADTVTGSVLGLLGTSTSFERMGGALMCPVRAFIMYPLHTVIALVDGCRTLGEVINLIDPSSEIHRWFLAGDPLFYNCNDTNSIDPAYCCGHPDGCTFPVDGGTDMPIGILPCFGELIRALTGDAVDDFIELIIDFLLPFIQAVIDTVTRAADCASLPSLQACLERYPTSGTAGVDDGVCFYDPPANINDVPLGVSHPDIIPDGGIYQCFGQMYTCLAFETDERAPLLVPLVDSGVLEFLLDSFWRFSLDVSVCTFVVGTVQPACFAVVFDFNEFINALNCVCISNPILGPMFGCPLSLVLSFINDIIAQIEVTLAAIQASVQVVIDIGAAAIAFAVTKINQIIQAIGCASNCNLGEVINGHIAECFDLDSIGGCDQGMFDGYAAGRARDESLPPKPVTEAEITEWRDLLWERHAVQPSSWCGTILYETVPRVAFRGAGGDYMAYAGCLSMYSIRRKVAADCGFIARNMTEISYAALDESALVGAWRLFAMTNCTAVVDPNAGQGLGQLADGTLAASLQRAVNASRGVNGTRYLFGGDADDNRTAAERVLPTWLYNANLTGWRMVPDLVVPVMTELRKLPAYHRTTEFYDAYKAGRAAGASNETLDALYVGWANDILARYRTGGWRNETYATVPDEVTLAAQDLAAGRAHAVTAAPRMVLDHVSGAMIPSVVGKEAAPMNRLHSPVMARYHALRRLTPQYLGRDGRVYRDVTIASMRAGPQRFWDRLEELHIADSLQEGRAVGLWGSDYGDDALGNDNATARSLALGGRRSAFAMSPEGREAWTAIDDATQMSMWSGFAKAAGLIRALRARDGRTLAALLRGEKQYLINTDEFVRTSVFEKMQPAAALTQAEMRASTRGGSGHDQPAPTLLTVGAAALAARAGIPLPFEVWNSQRPRAYAPFPFPLLDSGGVARGSTEPSWVPGAIRHLTATRARYALERKAKREAGTSMSTGTRATAEADFDVNQFFIDAIDAVWNFIVGLFGGEGSSPFATLTNDTVGFLEAFDFRDFALSNITDTLVAFVTCNIPENINGTGMRSPMCFLLMYEDVLSPLTYITDTEGTFPMQLQWPEELISLECRSPYNGVPDLINFQATNNCRLPLPPDKDENRTCDLGGVSCTGTVNLTMDPQVAPSQRFIGYNVVQIADGGVNTTCAVTQVAFPFPNDCANIVNVTSVDDCATSFTATAGSPSTEQLCSTPFSSPGVQGVLTVEFAGATVGSNCSFVVEYSIGVEPTAGPVTFQLAGEGQAMCAECELTLPSVTCQTADAPINDIYRDLRPLCDDGNPGCGYCAREYRTCADAGFADALDTFFYMTGVLPHVLDDLVLGGLSTKTFELWWGVPPTIIAALVLLPLMFAVIGIPIWVMGMNLLHLLPWFFFIVFGGIIPWAVLLLGFGVYMQFRKAPWWEMLMWIPLLITFPELPIGIRLAMLLLAGIGQSERGVDLVKPAFVIMAFITTLWVLSLVFTFPTFGETLNINALFSDIFLAIDSSGFVLYGLLIVGGVAAITLIFAVIFLATGKIALGSIAFVATLLFGFFFFLLWSVAFIIDFGPLIARIDQYNYPTPADVPALATFCFWTSWWSFAILGFVGLFLGGILRAAYRGVFAIVLWIIDIILYIFAIFFTARRVQIHARTRSNSTNVRRNRDRITAAYNKLRKASARQTTTVSARFSAMLHGESFEQADKRVARAHVAFDARAAALDAHDTFLEEEHDDRMVALGAVMTDAADAVLDAAEGVSYSYDDDSGPDMSGAAGAAAAVVVDSRFVRFGGGAGAGADNNTGMRRRQ